MDIMSQNEIPKTYSPRDSEDKWSSYWLENKIFHSEPDEKEPFTIVIPPPNVTGILHIGHILNNTIQDVYIRYKRMLGYNVCWVPGTDHASIATESKVVNLLKENGISKYDIGREEFLKHCWEWTEKYGGIIINQLKKLGASCDWERERFTMDDHYYKKVIEAFVTLYNEGLIYRGYRMVNWCPASKSAISDEEVEYKTVNGKLWHIRYLVEGTQEHVIVATTRPETMLGDTGIAVNPNDERYKNLVGKFVVLPIVGRRIPIFADDYVDMDFGTGAVKVTPAHDVNDYAMGERHNLESINIFNEDATTNGNVPEEFQELDRFVARKKIVARLKELGDLVKEEDYQNKVGYSQRGGVPIEPYLSEQWFMKMDELVKPALEVVRDGQIKFHPEHWIKTYEHWMTNIRDWCISRQLWWGHQIPVWYCVGDDHCKLECKEPIVSVERPERCPHCDSTNLRQEEDVLDTWASSWLWAQDVFTTEEEQNYYYPTSLLVTAPDIIFFWVARMIIAGTHFKNQIPFSDVYFTSLIRDEQGRKMSKSLGNSPDPIDVITEYGADALRFTINYVAPIGQDVLFSSDKCEIGRNFANKIWNAGRFLLMNADSIQKDQYYIDKHIDFTDRWIISRYYDSLKRYKYSLDNFDINGATKILYSFIWNDFCDWYIELAKNRLYSDDEEVKVAVITRSLNLFEELLKMLHPIMPFITEELWSVIAERKKGDSIGFALLPEIDETKIDAKAISDMTLIQNIVTAIRNIRGEMNIPPSKKINVELKIESLEQNQIDYIKLLGKVESLNHSADLTKPKTSASSVVKGCEIYIPLEGLIDLEVERQRIDKEIKRIEGALIGVERKLSNEKFVGRAPTDVVEKEKTKKADWENSLEKLREIFADLS
ncbi:MAG: valine--tRNA ligase [Melioribacteraceae bacterium]|nr:valine--tRNA ligase [Melioribacteraceae bacterium]MCF8263219.1 valine--tRNA ligase [Melioribacteraceae bacterium]MCF8431196.1 valine--tRNA ligase [Melioribacteraceae bacterium]